MGSHDRKAVLVQRRQTLARELGLGATEISGRGYKCSMSLLVVGGLDIVCDNISLAEIFMRNGDHLTSKQGRGNTNCIQSKKEALM